MFVYTLWFTCRETKYQLQQTLLVSKGYFESVIKCNCTPVTRGSACVNCCNAHIVTHPILDSHHHHHNYRKRQGRGGGGKTEHNLVFLKSSCILIWILFGWSKAVSEKRTGRASSREEGRTGAQGLERGGVIVAVAGKVQWTNFGGCFIVYMLFFCVRL